MKNTIRNTNIQKPNPLNKESTLISNKKQVKNVMLRIHKDNVITDFKHKDGNDFDGEYVSILIKVSNDFSFWISESYVFSSDYHNWLSVYVNPAKEYPNANKESKELPSCLGQTIIDFFNGI